MTAVVTLRPGWATLADWRNVAHGAAVRLDPAAAPMVEASARAVDAIIARGRPVYGIKTGFGKLASALIPAGDLPRFSATSCYRMRLAWASQCNRQPYA